MLKEPFTDLTLEELHRLNEKIIFDFKDNNYKVFYKEEQLEKDNQNFNEYDLLISTLAYIKFISNELKNNVIMDDYDYANYIIRNIEKDMYCNIKQRHEPSISNILRKLQRRNDEETYEEEYVLLTLVKKGYEIECGMIKNDHYEYVGAKPYAMLYQVNKLNSKEYKKI